MLVVGDVLCFMKHKFGKTKYVKLLKSALLDFYDVELLRHFIDEFVN